MLAMLSGKSGRGGQGGHAGSRGSVPWWKTKAGFSAITIAGLLAAGVLILTGYFVAKAYEASKFRFVNIFTECGLIVGFEETRVPVFLGIPYALPPIGNLRYRAPQLIAPGSKVCWRHRLILATSYGPVCSQPINWWSEGFSCIGSDDCLYLNIWTPNANRKANFSVVVYIHGGDFMRLGSSFSSINPSPEIATSTNLVYVSFNYRLNVAGFMSLNFTDWPKERNLGVLDAVAALKWVKHFIRYFGGNPSNVTLIGVEAGASMIYALLAIPEARELFARAWLMDPASNVKLHSPEKSGQKALYEKISYGCSSFACLQNVDTCRIIELIQWEGNGGWLREEFCKIPSGKENIHHVLAADETLYSIEDQLYKATRKPPLLVGTSSQMMDDCLSYQDRTMSQSELSSKLNFTCQGDHFCELELLRFANSYSPRWDKAYSSFLSQLRAICGQRELLKSLRNWDVYLYQMDQPPSIAVRSVMHPLRFVRYAGSGWAIVALFDSSGCYINPLGLKDQQLTKTLRSLLLSFISDQIEEKWKWMKFNKYSQFSPNLRAKGIFYPDSQDVCSALIFTKHFDKQSWISL